MNVKRFTARTSRDALGLVRQAYGDDAVILSTRPCPGGVEVMAMAADAVGHYATPINETKPATSSALRVRQPSAAEATDEDVAALSMSTLSFQDYVRERMLRKREAAIAQEAQREQALAQSRVLSSEPGPISARMQTAIAETLEPAKGATLPVHGSQPSVDVNPPPPNPPLPAKPMQLADVQGDWAAPSRGEDAPEVQAMLAEMRAMKGLIEDRFGALAFIEKLQCHPAQARLSQRLLEAGYSPALIRKLTESMPAGVQDEMPWAAQILEHNLLTASEQPDLEEQGGTLALIGATGVGKTTTTAKLAAGFAMRHGSGQLGLITLDAYRVGAQEQLRGYGRILGVPVHTAHDRASLEDLLDLLSGKRMVLIDTAGMPQRDSRTAELLDMLAHRSIQKILVLNAASQGETLDDVVQAYRVPGLKGVVLSKIDEAVKLAPALDVLIRQRLTLWGQANGQRVPEDWHRLSATALIQRSLTATGAQAWRVDGRDVQLVFSSAGAGMRSGPDSAMSVPGAQK